MSKIDFYLRIFYQLFVLRFKYIYLIFSFFFFIFLKIFKNKDYQKYKNFFRNFLERDNNNIFKKKFYTYKFF